MAASRRWTPAVMPPHEVVRRFGELQPCPFCTSTHLGIFSIGDPHVMCGNCGAEGPAVDGNREDMDIRQMRAAHLWNVRMTKNR